MLKKHLKWLIPLIAAVLIIFCIFQFNTAVKVISYELTSKDDLYIKLSKINESVDMLSAEPSNQLAIRVEVRNKEGLPVPMAHIEMTSTKNLGYFVPNEFRTNEMGQCLINYIPPDINGKQIDRGIDITLTASFYGTSKSSSAIVKLVKVPVVMVHGYQESPQVFDNMKDYLQKDNLSINSISYNSLSSVAASSNDLEKYLIQQSKNYISNGTQVKKFDIVCHSMGGLVSRYYTCSSDYILNNNVRKLIFISVPHKGSPWASIGSSYYSDKGVQDLVPDNPLISKTFPLMLNKGLNNSIEVGNIRVEYDEVVSPESASLSEWNIETEVFNIGKSNFTMESILSGNLVQAPNHKNILNNRKAFEAVQRMLNGKLPFPDVKK